MSTKYKCKRCSMTFSSESEAKRHWAQRHGDVVTQYSQTHFTTFDTSTYDSGSSSSSDSGFSSGGGDFGGGGSSGGW